MKFFLKFFSGIIVYFERLKDKVVNYFIEIFFSKRFNEFIEWFLIVFDC